MILIDSIWKTPMPCLLFNVFCYKHKVGFSIDSERKGKKMRFIQGSHSCDCKDTAACFIL